MDKFLDYLNKHNNIIDYVSGAVYLTMLMADETIGIAGTPDLKDIPFGLIGLFLFALSRKYNKKITSLLEE